MQTAPTDAHFRRRGSYLALAVAPLLALSIAASVLMPATASAANFTWSGGAAVTPGDWSNAANWSGGTAPSSGVSIGTVTFPNPSSSHNDLTGVSAEHLAVDNGSGFGLSGNALTLGSGGLSFAASQHPPIFSTNITAPLALSASQTWNVSAPAPPSELNPPEDLISFQGQLTGASSDLTINLNTLAQVALGSFFEFAGPDDEIGNVTVNGSDTVIPATNSEGEPIELVYKSFLFLPVGLNGSDGKSLTVKGISLSSSGPLGPLNAVSSGVGLTGSGIGPVTSTSSQIDISGHAAGLSLDSGSSLGFLIDAEGSTPGTDYDQLSSSGAIVLGGAALRLSSFQGAGNKCPAPPIGQVYTLLSTTGSLTGGFSNVANGGTATAECVDTSPPEFTVKVYSYRVNLNTGGATKTLTATALPAVPTAFPEEPQPPTISGTAVVGQTLTDAHGGWTNKPTSYDYKWERCNGSGHSCVAIGGATAQSYTPSAADVGSTLRVAETAHNSEGGSQPQASAATAVVQAAGLPPVGPPDGPPNVGPLGPSGQPGSSGGGQGGTVVTAQLAALLRRLASSSQTVQLGNLLKHGGLSLPFSAPEAGALAVSWYLIPKGGSVAKRAKPVLVASGKQAFRGAGLGKVRITLTARGRQFLKRAKRMTLTVRSTFTPVQGGPVAVVSRVTLRR
jgi:hypothetical protein